MNMTAEVQEKLATVTDLPSLQNIFPEVYKLMNDSKSSIIDFERVIKKDPSLSIKVLKIINSPYYGLRRKVGRLKQALALLGMEEIYRILMSISYYDGLKRSFTDVTVNFNRIWQHFQLTAAGAYVLATEVIPSKADEAFLCGLLHDTGKLLLDQFYPEEWQELVTQYMETQTDMTVLEENTFGYDHASIAGEFFLKSNLPEDIIIPVIYHHRPLEVPEKQDLTALIYGADQIATRLIKDDKTRITTQESEDESDTWRQIMEKYPSFNLLEDKNRKKEFLKKVKNKIY